MAAAFEGFSLQRGKEEAEEALVLTVIKNKRFLRGKSPLLRAINHGTRARSAAGPQQGTPRTFLGTTYRPKSVAMAFLLLPLLSSLLSLTQPLDMLTPRLPTNLWKILSPELCLFRCLGSTPGPTGPKLSSLAYALYSTLPSTDKSALGWTSLL